MWPVRCIRAVGDFNEELLLVAFVKYSQNLWLPMGSIGEKQKMCSFHDLISPGNICEVEKPLVTAASIFLYISTGATFGALDNFMYTPEV